MYWRLKYSFKFLSLKTVHLNYPFLVDNKNGFVVVEVLNHFGQIMLNHRERLV